MAGTHGAGVNTPDAAVVAACTAGFAGDMHIPNDAMFVSGTKSVTVASGAGGGELAAMCGGPGITVSTDGVERVEVIKGAAALQYGSDAIGGVVNVIDEKPAPIDSTSTASPKVSVAVSCAAEFTRADLICVAVQPG